jgi:hypothetical protein
MVVVISTDRFAPWTGVNRPNWSPRTAKTKRLRYQRLIGAENRVANAVPFGRRLRRFLREPEQRLLAPSDSWRTDGCWMLADALTHWSKGELKMVALIRPDEGVAHVVTEEPSLGAYLDADGVAGKLELMAKMAMVMREPQVRIAPFSALDARMAGLTYDENTAVELALRLLRRFSRYNPALLALPERAA